MHFNRVGGRGHSAFRFMTSGAAVALSFALFTARPVRSDEIRPRPTMAAGVSEPIRLLERVDAGRYLRLELDIAEFAAIKHGDARRLVRLPLPEGGSLDLDMTRFSVVTPETRFVVAGPDGQTDIAPPDVVTLRGTVSGDPASTAYLALGADGHANGYIESAGRHLVISSLRIAQGVRAGGTDITLHEAATAFAVPEFEEFCGVATPSEPHGEAAGPRGSTTDIRGPKLARVAIEGDQEYVGLFGGDAFAAEAYVVDLMGAVGNIYYRDLNVSLVLTFVRLWPAGGEPFEATDIYTLYDYYTNNEPWFNYNYVHLFSGRRDTGYGGIAFVGGTCQGFAYGISAFMLGAFPSPVEAPHLGNWDVIVVAHEMGHNSGTYHTHDGYTPVIDNCGNGVPSRGTIMSYCHTFPGGVTNTQLFMHRRVEDVIEAELNAGGCFFDFDCNLNGVSDFDDIALGNSLDANANTLPDECEDCNANGIPDEDDVILGAPDVNGNFIPDVCEPDCNANATPDAYECDLNPSNDVDGNNVPDECDPDCNANGTLDWADVNTGGFVDVDRNFAPDVCQDCNANGVADWIELGRADNLFVADRADYLREYYSTSGYPVGNVGAGGVLDPYDCVFGPDRRLYVASFADDRIVRIDVDTGAATDFVSAGSGGLDGPSGLVFGPNGNLFVASRNSRQVLEFDGATGAFVQVFVTDLVGPAIQPFGLTFGPDDNLYVTCSNNTVRRYNGASGAFISTFVTATSATLNDPRGLVFLPSGDLLVTNFAANNVRRYDSTGISLGVFNQTINPEGAWGIRLGPAGTVFVVRSLNGPRVYEYRTDGILLRSYVRGDGPLPTPTGLDFRTGFVADCNANLVLDTCDPEWTDVALFVSTLLSDPPDPTLACMYNRNGDGQLDAQDVQPFVDDLIP